MRVSVLCDSIQATQTISFCFDQHLVPLDKQIDFQLLSWLELKKIEPTLRFKKLFDCDYLILSRWYEPNTVEKIINKARDYGKKIYFHLDDFLFCVPKSIGIEKWLHYSSPRMLDAIYMTAEMCDGIIASTSRLGQAISEILPERKILISPYYKNFDFKYLSRPNTSIRVYPCIGYMGTQSHADDLELITSDLDVLMNQNPFIKFETFGIDMPKFILEKYPHRCITLPKVNNYSEFQSLLSSRGWWFGLAPLVESKFNYCKANTKFIEYIQAGIPVIASKFGPYMDTPSITNISNMSMQPSWLEQMEILLSSRLRRDSLYLQQFNHCKQYSDTNLLVDFYNSILF